MTTTRIELDMTGENFYDVRDLKNIIINYVNDKEMSGVIQFDGNTWIIKDGSWKVD
jgi:hypothetical protein